MRSLPGNLRSSDAESRFESAPQSLLPRTFELHREAGGRGHDAKGVKSSLHNVQFHRNAGGEQSLRVLDVFRREQVDRADPINAGGSPLTFATRAGTEFGGS